MENLHHTHEDDCMILKSLSSPSPSWKILQLKMLCTKLRVMYTQESQLIAWGRKLISKYLFAFPMQMLQSLKT